MIRSTHTLIATVAVAVFFASTPTRGEDSAAGKLHPRVKMTTSLGAFVLELNGEKAPISTLNFIQYVEDGFYNGTIFHRVIPSFMIQGGGFLPSLDVKKDGLRGGIKNEWRNGLKNNRGTIAMARTSAPDSATSQFFINVVDNASLDMPRGGAAYAVFGKVVEGMDVVDRIRYTPVGTSPKYGGGRNAVVPKETVVIQSAEVVGGWDRAAIEAQAAGAEAAAKKERESKMAQERKKLGDVIAEAEKVTGHKITVTDSGLMYAHYNVGTGDSPKPTDRVKVHYTGWLTDGTKFDSSVDRGQPATFPLNGVIKGWTEGLGLMKAGGKTRFIIPPDLAYGKRGRPSIPGDSVLVFDVELIEIK